MKIEDKIRKISYSHYHHLLSLKNVVGVGLGHKWINGVNTYEPCLHVLVKNKVSKQYLCCQHLIPKTYMGLRTDVIDLEFSTTNETPFNKDLDKKIKLLLTPSKQSKTELNTIQELLKEKADTLNTLEDKKLNDEEKTNLEEKVDELDEKIKNLLNPKQTTELEYDIIEELLKEKAKVIDTINNEELKEEEKTDLEEKVVEIDEQIRLLLNLNEEVIEVDLDNKEEVLDDNKKISYLLKNDYLAADEKAELEEKIRILQEQVDLLTSTPDPVHENEYEVVEKDVLKFNNKEEVIVEKERLQYILDNDDLEESDAIDIENQIAALDK